jgi:hypothetical protein
LSTLQGPGKCASLATEQFRGDERGRNRRAIHGHKQCTSGDQVGNIDANTRAVFGRSYVAKPDVLVKELAGDEAIKGPIRCSSRSRTSRVWTTTPRARQHHQYVAPELGWR